MKTFELGDRVICTDSYIKNREGIIVARSSHLGDMCGVYFQEEGAFLHDLLEVREVGLRYLAEYFEEISNSRVCLKDRRNCGRWFTSNNMQLAYSFKQYTPEQSGDTEEDI